MLNFYLNFRFNYGLKYINIEPKNNIFMTNIYPEELGDYKKPSSQDEEVKKEDIANDYMGIPHPWRWPVTILSTLIYIGAVVINYVFGRDTGDISDKFRLYVTPPGLFFSIWIVIFSVIFIVCIINVIKNLWNWKAHLCFLITNILISAWILVFAIGTLPAIIVSVAIIVLLAMSIFLTWYFIGQVPIENYSFWVYLMRNGFAFYLGWVVAATNLNFGMDIVYWWGGSKKLQLIIFWIMAPLSAIGITSGIVIKEGWRGLLGCFCLWLSVIWAFVGAAISSQHCLSGDHQDC